MSLPSLIEIIPLKKTVRARLAVPGSKSITNRALILAVLAQGDTEVTGALWSEDTQVMVEALRQLGFKVEVAPDPDDSCNRIITVRGEQGRIPRGGTASDPLTLFVGNAGTVARFLSALACLGTGFYRLEGTPRMHERPQVSLFRALRQLGYSIESANDRLPAIVKGNGPQPRQCEISVIESSQFASALLLCAQRGQWEVKVKDSNAEELPYVNMTSDMIRTFPQGGGTFRVEPDASSGSYFWAASWILSANITNVRVSTKTGQMARRSIPQASEVVVRHWPHSRWQVDTAFPRFLPLPASVSHARDLGDSIMTAMVLAPFGTQPVSFTDLGRLRLQECERVTALRTEFTRCGIQVEERGDALRISPSTPHGAEIETYDDHRIAMCFSLLGLKVPGIRIRNPACVKKTFPNYFQKLAAPPPSGLGLEIRAPATGRVLSLPELFAE